MKTLVIDREKWARSTNGIDKGISALLNGKGNMCCLGFACKQLYGVDDSLIDNVGEPSEVYEVIMPLLNQKTGEIDDETGELMEHKDNTVLSDDAISINDNSSLPDSCKESLLIELFKNHNIELTFIN